MNIENKVNTGNELFSELRKKNWCEYKLPKNFFGGLKLIGNALYNGNYKELKKEFQRTEAFENADDVLSIFPYRASTKYINQLIKYVGEKGKEGEFIGVVGKLAEENPKAEFYINSNGINIAEEVYSKLKDKGIENLKKADTTMESTKNLLQHGGFGVVIRGIQEDLIENLFHYSINRNKMICTDPLWNKSYYRSGKGDCTRNQHNHLLDDIFGHCPVIAISGNSFYASGFMGSKKKKNFAEKVFNYLFLSKENIETPLPGKNVSEEQRKKVERNLREFKTENELINGTFIAYAWEKD